MPPRTDDLLRRQITEIQRRARGAEAERFSGFIPTFLSWLPLSRSAGSHHPVWDIFWNSAGSMFADYFLAAMFDCQMCRTSAIRGSLKRTSGVRSCIAALPRTEDISQIDPCSRDSPSGC